MSWVLNYTTNQTQTTTTLFQENAITDSISENPYLLKNTLALPIFQNTISALVRNGTASTTAGAFVINGKKIKNPPIK